MLSSAPSCPTTRRKWPLSKTDTSEETPRPAYSKTITQSLLGGIEMYSNRITPQDSYEPRRPNRAGATSFHNIATIPPQQATIAVRLGAVGNADT